MSLDKERAALPAARETLLSRLSALVHAAKVGTTDIPHGLVQEVEELRARNMQLTSAAAALEREAAAAPLAVALAARDKAVLDVQFAESLRAKDTALATQRGTAAASAASLQRAQAALAEAQDAAAQAAAVASAHIASLQRALEIARAAAAAEAAARAKASAEYEQARNEADAALADAAISTASLDSCKRKNEQMMALLQRLKSASGAPPSSTATGKRERGAA